MVEHIRKVGVIGAGQMGAGIAQVSAQAGYRVLLTDVDKARAEAASAAPLAEAIAQQEVVAQQEITAGKRVGLRKQELDAEIRAKADADAYALEKDAQAAAAAAVIACRSAGSTAEKNPLTRAWPRAQPSGYRIRAIAPNGTMSRCRILACSGGRGQPIQCAHSTVQPYIAAYIGTERSSNGRTSGGARQSSCTHQATNSAR